MPATATYSDDILDAAIRLAENGQAQPPRYDDSLLDEAIALAESQMQPAVEPEESGRTVGGTLKDVAISAGRGVVGLGEAAVGLADIPTFGRVGKAMEDYLGYDPEATNEFLGRYYSAAQKEANLEVEKAEGLGGKLKAMLKHPSTIGHAVVESAPLMGGGAAAARTLLAKGLLASPLVAGAVGEGLVSAGSSAEQVRQQTEDGLLTLKQSLIPVASGVGTSVFALAGGRIAQKMGLIDVDTFLAGGGNVTKIGVVKRIIGGGISEGAFEELPQSMQEQIWLNAALDKPLMEGVPEAGATGGLVGTAMGAGFNIFTGRATDTPEQAPDPQQALAEIQAGLESGEMVPQDALDLAQKPEFQGIAADIADLANEYTIEREAAKPLAPEAEAPTEGEWVSREDYLTRVEGLPTSEQIRREKLQVATRPETLPVSTEEEIPEAWMVPEALLPAPTGEYEGEGFETYEKVKPREGMGEGFTLQEVDYDPFSPEFAKRLRKALPPGQGFELVEPKPPELKPAKPKEVPPVPAEKVVPFSERPTAEKKLVEKYNKKMTSGEWEADYAQREKPHWMEGQEHSPLADELTKDLKSEKLKKADILEIGIGNGRDSIFLASKGHRVTGIDLAEKAVEAAQEKSKGVQNVSFEVGNAEKLKFAPESFNAVYSVAALHSTPLRFTLREINRVLKPGGTAKLFLYTRTKTGAKWVSYWTPGEIKQFATEEGFKVERFREGHDLEPIDIPGVEGKVEQETHLVVTTLKKPADHPELTAKAEPAKKEPVTSKKGPGEIPTTETPVSPKGGKEIEAALKSRRVEGDNLLDALDLADDLAEKNAEISKDGIVTLYHRTSKSGAEEIIRSGRMVSKEDRLFFGTHPTGQIEGYGDAVVRVYIPLEKLELNDVFSGEAHVTMESGRIGTAIPIKAEAWKSLPKPTRAPKVGAQEVPAKPSPRAVTIQMPKEIMAISGTEGIKNAIDSMRAMAKTGANKNKYGVYLIKEGDLAAIEDFVAEIEDFVISKGGTPGDVGGIKDYVLGDLAADPKTNINTQSKGIWKPVDDWRKIVGELTEEVPTIRMITKRKDDVVVSFEGRVPSAAMSKLMSRFEQLSEYEGYSSGFAIDENIHWGDTNVGIKGISESKIKELLGIRKIEKKISTAKPSPGSVFIKNKQFPFREYRELARGKNEGKVVVTLPDGKKKVVEKADVAKWPDVAEKTTEGRNYQLYWDSKLKTGRKVDLIEKSGWVAKVGKLTRAGEKMAESKWDSLTPAAQNILKRHIDSFYEVATSDIDAAKSRIVSTLKDQRGSFSLKQKEGPAVYEDLLTVGKHYINQGYTKWSGFRLRMKDALSEIWDKVRGVISRVFVNAKKILKSEKGAVTIEGVKGAVAPEAPYGYGKTKTMQEILDSINAAQKRKPTTADREGKATITDYMKATLKGMDPKELGIFRGLQTLFGSPEWSSDKRQQQTTQIAIDRGTWYHENFNEFNDTSNKDISSPFETIADSLVALGRKDNISKFAFAVRGKRSKEYKQLEQFIDEADIMGKKWTAEEIYKQKALSDDAIHVWELLRKSYDDQLDAMQKPMMDLIDEITEKAVAQGIDPVYPDFGKYTDEKGKTRKVDLKEALMMMGEYRGSYAPRFRKQGDWVVQGKKPGKRFIRKHARTKISAEWLKLKLENEGYEDVTVKAKEQLLESTFAMLKVMEIGAAIEHATEKSEKLKEYDETIRMAFLEDMLVSAADLIKSRGARRAMIRRRKGEVVTGYETDPIDRFVRYTSNNSAAMAKARAAKEMFGVLFGEYKYIKKPGDKKAHSQKVGGIDQAKEPAAHRNLSRYISEQLRNPERADRIIGLLKSITTFKYLGFNPRSILVNVTALVTTTPVAIHQYAMGGKGSLTKVLIELNRASKDYAKVMAGKRLKGPNEQAFIEEQRAKGWTDPQYMREAVGHIQGAYGSGWSKAMGTSMWAFGKSEEWVRGATMLAAFRLARKQGVKPTEAAQRARKASDRAHATYGKPTYPVWAQGTGPAAKVGQMAYVYAKFPHNALQMYYDVGVKKKNVKGIIYALGAPVVLSGTAAFPMYATVMWILNGMLKAIGDDRDIEKMVYDTMREQLGEPTEKRIRRGVLGEMGIDVTGSLSMGPGELPSSLLDLTGAIGSVLTDLYRGGELLIGRQPGKAAEKLMPTAFANLLRAKRELKGATTSRGNRIWDEKGGPYVPTKGETGLRTVGFRSARRAQLAATTWHGKREQMRFSKTLNKIYEKLRAYLFNPDDKELYQSLIDDIDDYNRAANKARTVPLITRQSIDRQITRMRKPTKRHLRAMGM